MTSVVMTKNGETIKEFYLSGHAGFGRKGKDIVCAAVSALSINAVNSLELLCDEKPEVLTNEKDGFLRCIRKAPYSKEGDLIMKSLELGLKGIASEYGNRYLDVKIQEVETNVKA